MSALAAAVEADGLQVVRGRTVALDGLDLRAPTCSITAVLGPNGAGKTTLTRAVSTLQPYRGSLRVAGQEVAHRPGAVRSLVAVASQHTALPPQHTAHEYLRLAGRLRGLRRRGLASAVEELVEQLELAEFVDQRLVRCSGGQRRRVALAATLLGGPSVVVLDEPTAGLDPHSRLGIWEHLLGLRDAGVALLLTTQDLDEAARLADHVAILHRGRCRAAGPLEELRAAQRLQRLTITTTDGPDSEDLLRLARTLDADVHVAAGRNVLVGSFDLAQVTDALRQSGLHALLRELHLQPPSLEEIYRMTLETATEEAA